MSTDLAVSSQVHPDKNPGADATEAFEALKQAHRLLKDPGELVRKPAK
jgi:curved DNA-binding protein CbpA